VVCFAQTTGAQSDENAGGRVAGRVTMQIIRECRMRAAILTGIAKDAPELEVQLLYVAKEHLTLAILSEQLNVGTDRAAHNLPVRV
jgi:hypothetical protein